MKREAVICSRRWGIIPLVCIGLLSNAWIFANAANPDGDLRIEVFSAYNFVVDSNVESPSTYAPRAAYLGAKFHNDGTEPITNLFMYIGNYTNGAVNTPGIYPTRAHPPLDGPLPLDEFSLTHLSGDMGTTDATRFITRLDPGEFVVAYWLVTYPNLDELGKATHGPSVKPYDDLWLEYDIWAQGFDNGVSVEAEIMRTVTMRNEISAMANKIWPNGANKVPQEYKDLLAQYEPTWTNSPQGVASPGAALVSEGFWYDLGNVGDGFDNDGDLVPDRNAWMQPVGDYSTFDSASFRLVRTYALVVVKLNDGTEEVYDVVDQLYFENIPANNRGAVGLVQYVFVPLQPERSSMLTPYQEVASGYDNEKFNGDFGTTIGRIESGTSMVQLVKSVNKPVGHGGELLWYDIEFTNSGDEVLGDPSLGMPMVVQDSIPTGTYYIAGTALISNSLPAGVSEYTLVFSTNNGIAWQFGEPAIASNVTDIQWWLSDEFDTQTVGRVSFQVRVLDPYWPPIPIVWNEGGLSFGNTPAFMTDDATTLILGTNAVGDTVFRDDGSGVDGILANGIQDGSETGMVDITITLYYDGNSNGVLDSSDVWLATNSTDITGYYLFTNMPDGNFIAIVDENDPDLPYGYAVTRPTSVAVPLDAAKTNPAVVSYLDADFAFAPILDLDKSIIGSSTNYEGDTLTYSIAITNRIDGNGGLETFTLWSTTVDDANCGSGSKAWDFTNNAPFAPDGLVADAPLANAGELLALNGFYLALQDGMISNVWLYIEAGTNGPVRDNDEVTVNLLYDSVAVWTTNYFPFYVENGLITVDITGVQSWEWTDFSATNTWSIQLDADKGTGKAPGGTYGLDAVGFYIESDWVGGAANPATTLDPVPLTDTYDADKLRYVSASISPTTSTTNGADPDTVGTLYWSNVGPLQEGGGETITVQFEVLEPPDNTNGVITNVAYVANVTYGDGRPANSITDVVTSVVLPAGSIGDYVWRDVDRDGTQDVDEVGFENVAVILSVPAGVDVGNGPGNPVTNYTDSSGYYLFDGLPEYVTYTVTVDTVTLPGATYTNTYDEDGNKDDQTAVLLNVFADDGSDTHLTADFGYYVDSSIEGTIWHDHDISGTSTPDPGEEWLTSVTVYLYSGTTPGATNTAVATNQTDASGYFQFVGDYGGDYVVDVVTNSGDLGVGIWSETYDTDGLGTADFVAFNLPTGGYARADYSFYQSGPFNIGDTLYYDWDGNGNQNTTNEEGIASVTVYLYEDENGDGEVDPAADALFRTDVTDTDGEYLFQNLPPGTYLVVVKLDDPDMPDRYNITGDPEGPNDGKSVLTISSASNLDQDFGFQPYGYGSIGDLVWKDLDANGEQGAPSFESGITNITLTLYSDFSGDGTYVVQATTQTVAEGYYIFDNLPDGNYMVQVSTNGTDLPQDAFGNVYIPTTTTQVYTVISNGNDYLDADFGFAALGAIGDTIFWDANQNGTQDWNEDGVDGVTVTLYIDDGSGYYEAGSDTFYGSDVTDTNGNYLFTSLPTNTYIVVVTTNIGPLANSELMADPDSDGVPASDPTAVDADSQHDVRIGPGTTYMGADFGYVPDGVLGDAVWLDINRDGIYDSNEVGIAYVPVELWSNGVLVATNLTDGDGYYIFSDLDDGTYQVVVVTNSLGFPAQVAQVFDRDGLLDDVTTNIVINGGTVESVNGVGYTNHLGMDFGYTYTGTNILSGTVCLEGAPIDGVCGSGDSGVGTNEVPYSSVSVYLWLWNDDGNGIRESGEARIILSTTTSTNGDYSFTDMPDGGVDDYYIVSLSAPEENIQLTTTNGLTPATLVTNITDVLGNTVSSYQVIPIAPTTVGVDFAFKSGVSYDYGDLPSIYGTRLQDSPKGARHRQSAVPDLYLGATVDNEINGQPSVNADGDGSDEDGVRAHSAWQSGGSGYIEAVVGAGTGWLVGYVDLNNDGDFLDTGEMVASHIASDSGSGTYTNTFSIPTNAISSTTTTQFYARFRLLPEQPAFPEFASIGKADNGEVEDYLFKLGAIGDFLWKDTDADQVFDPTESPLTNVTVFIDLDLDNVFDPDEPFAVTDTNGYYGIGGLSTGSYTVVVYTNENFPPYLSPTYDLDGTNTPHRAVTNLDVAGEVILELDFGYAPMALGGFVWDDTDMEGDQDEVGITGVSNILIRLYDGDSNWVATTYSDTNGYYSFDIDAPGTFFMESFPIGHTISPIDQAGGDDTLDSDYSATAPYRTIHTSLAAGDRQMDWDLGLYVPATSNTLGDRVWLDDNMNGIQDEADAGVAGVTVILYDPDTNLVEQTVTDFEGYYYFSGVPVGSYRVWFDKPGDHFYSPANKTADWRDSDADTNGFTGLITMGLGTINTNVDAGIYAVLDLGVTKVVNNAAPDPGDTVWFTMVLTNNGPSDATGVVLEDTWPTNITVIGAGETLGSYDTNTAVWTIGDMSNGWGAELVITGLVHLGSAGKSITNTITITDVDQPDTNSANDTAYDVIVPGALDLGIVKTVDDPNPWPGSNVTYTIVLTNNGPKDATSVHVTDPLTNGITYVSHVAGGTSTYNSVSGLWNVGDLNASNAITLTITATVTNDIGGTSITNWSTIVNLDQEDTVATNNTDDAIVTVVGADLAVTKTPSGVGFAEGDTVVYTIAITNKGPNDTTGVALTDPLTNGIGYVSYIASTGSYDSASGLWTIGDMLVGAFETLSITTTVDVGTAGMAITNISTIVSNDLQDPTPEDNYDDAVIFVSNLQIDKTSDATGLLNPGDTIIYTIVVTNSGEVFHTDVTVTDTVPPSVTYVAASAQKTYPYTENHNIKDEFGTVAYTNSDGSLDWNADWTVLGTPTYVEVATEGDPANALHITRAPHGASRDADLSSFREAILTFDYRRDSLDDATEYLSVAVSTNGVNFVELTQIGNGSDGSYQSSGALNISAYMTTNTTVRFLTQGMGNGDDVYVDNVNIAVARRLYTNAAAGDPPNLSDGHTLEDGEYMEITWQATVDTPPTVQAITNTAWVSSDLVDPPISDYVIDPIAVVDLGVIKHYKDDSTAEGPGTNEVIWWTVILTNEGPIDATTVELTDTWPSEYVNYNSYWASTGTYNNATKIWDGFDLAVNESVTLIISGRVDALDENILITNVITITDLDQYDPNPANDEDDAVTETLVILSDFRAFLSGGHVAVEWETMSEINTAGFYIERKTKGGWLQVNPGIVPAVPGAPQGGVYSVPDPTADAEVALTYRLVELELNGKRNFYGPFEVACEMSEDRSKALITDYSAKARRSASKEARIKRMRIERLGRKSRGVKTRLERSRRSRTEASTLGTVKVCISEPGVYRVTAAEIAAVLGTTEADIRGHILTGDAALSNNGSDVAHLRQSGGIAFYGEGADSIYTDTNVYWITWDKGSVAVQAEGGSPAAAPGGTFDYSAHFEQEVYSGAGVKSDPDADFYLWDFLMSTVPASATKNFTVVLEDVSADPGTAEITVRIQGSTDMGRERDHRSRISVNGTYVGEGVWVGKTEKDIVASFDQSLLIDGTNVITVTAEKEPFVSMSIIYLDSIDVTYSRRYEAVNGQLVLDGDGNTVVTVDGFAASDLMALGLADSKQPEILANTTIAGNGPYSLSFVPADADTEYIVFSDASCLPVDAVAADQASSLRDGTNRARYIIITVPDFAAPADTLAAYRGGLGLSSMVVMLDDIYDEFGYGIADPNAIRTFLSYARINWLEPPQYVVIAGGGTYDYKSVGGNPDNIVPPLMISTPRGLFASDSRFADLDGDNVPDLAVGRLPVISMAEMQAQVEKIMNHEAAAAAAWRTKIIRGADIPDGGGHFSSSSDQIGALVPGGWGDQKIHLADTALAVARTQLIAEVNSGAEFFNFFGHAGLTGLGMNNLLKSTDVPSLLNSNKLTTITSMTCVMGRFGIPGFDTLGEMLLMSEDGGACAVWAPAGLSYNQSAEALAEGFYADVFAGEEVIGDAVLSGVDRYGDSGGPAYLPMVYNLLGDPAMIMGAGAASPYDIASIDEWKESFFTSAEQADGDISGDNVDPDGDGVSNAVEYQNGTNPRSADSDGDGYPDGAEIALGSDPTDTGDNPVLPSPDGGVTVSNKPVFFAWDTEPTALWYRLLLSRDGSTYLSQWNQGNSGWVALSELPGGSYSWWILPWDGATSFGWRGPYTFTVPVRVPGKTALLAPEGLSATNAPAFVWEADDDASWYRLWISRNGTGYYDQWLNHTTNHTLASSLTVGQYEWWVCTWGVDGLGAWSDSKTFAYGKTVAVSPTGGATVAGNPRPTLQWQAVNEATWYNLWIQQDGADYANEWIQGANTWLPDSDLPNASWTWWVRPWNDGAGPWSDPADFTTAD